MADDNTTTSSGGTQTDDNTANVTSSATQSARNAANPDINPRRSILASELEKMTAWEYLSQAGGFSDTLRNYMDGNSPGIMTLKDNYPTLCAAPARRELVNADWRTPGLKKMDFNLVSMLLYVAGVPPPESCCEGPDPKRDECQAMWDGCYVAPEGPMEEETHRACANCFYNGNQTRCTFYLDTRVDAYKEDLQRARRHGSDVEDDDDIDYEDEEDSEAGEDGDYTSRAGQQQVQTPGRYGLRSRG